MKLAGTRTSREPKCLDVAGATAQNVQLTQYTCTGAHNTHWYLDWAPDNSYFLIRNRATQQCVNISGNVYLNGRSIIQWPCNAVDNNERFRRTTAPNGNSHLESWPAPGKVVHQQGRQLQNNATVTPWEKNVNALNTQVTLVQQ